MRRFFHFIPLVAALFAVCTCGAASDFTVNFISPTNGAVVTSPLFLEVNTSDYTNHVVSVEYFANGNSIGISSNGPVTAADLSNGPVILPTLPIVFTPFLLYWSTNPGDYVLTAKATDEQGNVAFSDPISVTVIPLPVVTVEATQPEAGMSNPGVFTISRAGDTNKDLLVVYFLAGNASNGIDYELISNAVVIPAGALSASVTITPLRKSLRGQTKIVELELAGLSMWLPPPPDLGISVILNPTYVVGIPSRAAVYVSVSGRDHHKPTVKLTQPTNKQLIPFGTNILLSATASDPDTFVTSVQFFDGPELIGISVNPTSALPSTNTVFTFDWAGASIGKHRLRAIAADSQGVTKISAPVKIQVLPAP